MMKNIRGLKSKGFTLTLEFKNDGTGIETTTGLMLVLKILLGHSWAKLYVLKIACVPFEMAANEQTFRVNLK